ncbi:MAG: ergothioneine biosynthesis glutamate--cysteine ligase EgtA [Propionibacteriales bacterium]|nr:ergothioneine biosynthesis glutamate--cysteine ligase EgtA [Propionibacteriales bacterium]
MALSGAAAGDEDRESSMPICSRDDAERYVAMICFKHGPPRHVGVELEWTVHHADDPTRPIEPADLQRALGAYAPATLTPDSPHLPLPSGSALTVEPGGQVEISPPPQQSVATLLTSVDADIAALTALLAPDDLVLGEHGSDAHRPPRRILEVARYAAMQDAFDALGPAGSQMMCSTAALQVCLDAGEAEAAAARWTALHTVGPALVALFANSRRLAGRDTGWASSRVRSTLDTCPPQTGPPALDGDPAHRWAALAMEAPVICLRRDGASWHAPPGLTFGAWADGALGLRPTFGDLDYHLSTLFPPVRPRGYLEVRYLDSQPADRWRDPVLLLTALMADPATVDAATDAAERAADRWLPAAQQGLDDEPVLEAASGLVELGCAAMTRLDVDAAQVAHTTDHLQRRIDGHSMRRHSA